MSASPFARSRSPVMSIRTQPEEENSLRAEIQAARRTQDEISPRCSWHPAFTRRDSSYNNNTRPIYPPVLQKETFPSRLARSSTLHNGDDEHEAIPAATTTAHDTVAQLEAAAASKPLWRQFTKRSLKTELSDILPTKVLSTKSQDRGSRRWKKIRTTTRGNTDIPADIDREAQHAQFQAWLGERFAERDIVPDLAHTQVPKTRRTIGKSVKGSLSNTRDFFRPGSKRFQDIVRDTVASPSPSSFTPHIYSFETKDQLHAYLNHNDNRTSNAPSISSDGQSPRAADVPKDAQPAELSAGPLPVELEGTAPDGSDQSQAQPQPLVSRTSTPDVRDLPPYIDDKKFVNDIVKEQGDSSDLSRIKSLGDSYNVPTAYYHCSSCENSVTGEDVYDFCSSCSLEGRVVCFSCERRGRRCQHEVEGPLSSFTVNQSTPLPSTSAIQTTECRLGLTDIDATSQADIQTIPNEAKNVNDDLHPSATTNITDFASSHHSHPSDRSKYSAGNLAADFGNLRLDLLQEMTRLHRENEFSHRERELNLRARELEMRDQHITLREREGMVQQRSDTLLRHMETMLSYQQLAKGAYIGAQFQSQQHHHPKMDQPDVLSRSSSPCADCRSTLATLDRARRKHDGVVDKVVAHTGASMQDLEDSNTHIRSHGAQKRKKEGFTGASPESTTTATSSPENSRKSLSRGNSERNESQDEDDEGGRRFPKKHKQDPPTPLGQQLLFACPYSKRNPQRFSSRNTAEKNYRGCSTHYLPDVSRLKQHLKRVHWQPESYCPRCYEEFEDANQLMQHAQAVVPCLARECPFPEKMDKTKQDKIHVKRPRVPPETVWYDIYKVLFPGSPLPESPYADGDDRGVVTPSSATAPSTVNAQAIQMMCSIFERRLNQREEIPDPSMRQIIHQTLSESMSELLGSFSLSPTHSPVGGGPSIVVSPVSRSSSGKAQESGSPNSVSAKRPPFERKRSITDVISQPSPVPTLQHPKPKPKPKLLTALEVPHDPHRSPSSHSRHDSLGNRSPADVIFDINIASHVLEDLGYDDESRSFEQGDDRDAMRFFVENPVPSSRNLSVTSNKTLDSGYGSGKSTRSTHLPTSAPKMAGPMAVLGAVNQLARADYDDFSLRGAIQTPHPDTESLMPASSQLPSTYGLRNDNEFDPLFGASDQDVLFGGTDYLFYNQQNPWNIP